MAWTLATWNVNSLRVRLPHLIEWLAAHQPDIVALQETKLVDDSFPHAELAAAGYSGVSAGQKTYNGVAVLARSPHAIALEDIVTDIPNYPDEPRRVLAVTVGDVRVVDLYVPNGQVVGSDKYQYKLAWFAGVTAWLREELTRHPRLVVAGDFNVAPEDRDVHDPAAWEGKVLFSEPEKEALRGLVALGLTDAFRLFDQPERSFSWWDYRMLGFQRKQGLRIDHILLSTALVKACTACRIDIEPRKAERPSDHAPVMATFAS